MKLTPCKAVSNYLDKYSLHHATIICALSGGADSMVLLHSLLQLRGEYDLNLMALHINHGIRGEEAKRDEEFCRDYCLANDVPFILMELDVPKLAASNKTSLETTARNARYDRFNQVLSQYKGAFIATAHNATDNVETILFRMARGTALRGLCGIPPKRERYIRPLLQVTAEEIRAWAEQENVPYVVDSTNQETAYTRNYVRQVLIPSLEQVHTGALAHISSLIEHASEDEAYLSQEAGKILMQEDHLRDALASAPKPLAYRAIRILYERVQVSNDALTEEQITSIYELLLYGEKNAQLTLPAGVTLVIEGQYVGFVLGEEGESSFLLEVKLGENILPNDSGMFIVWNAPITEDTFPSLNIYRKLIHLSVNSARINGGLYIRTKQDGDTYRYGGMTHKLKRMFSDRKFSLSTRKKWPILCDQEGILWVPGFSVRDGVHAEQFEKTYFCYAHNMEATK